MSWLDSLRNRVMGSSSGEESTHREEMDRNAPISSSGMSRGEPRDEEIERVKPEKLEKYYFYEPLAYAGVNFYVNHVTGEDYKIMELEGQDSNKKHKVRDFLSKVSFNSKLDAIMRDMGIYGNAFIELVWNKKGDELVDLVILDPKDMEFLKAKNDSGEEVVAVDEMGDPIGYIQKIDGFGSQRKDVERYKEIVSDFDHIDMDHIKVENGIPFHRDEIAHFRLQLLSDSLMGVGLIEPVFDTITLKIESEEALGDGLKRAATPDLVGKAGTFDEQEPVRSGDTDALKSSLENMRKGDFGVIAIPEYYDISQLEPDIAGQQEYYRMFSDLIAVGMGLPPGLISRGADVGTGVAEIQNSLTEKVIKSFQNSISRDCREQIFEVILDANKISETPDMKWKDLNILTKGKKVRRIGELLRAGAITRDRRLEQHLRDLEDLPPLPEETEDEEKERKEQANKNISRSSLREELQSLINEEERKEL